MAKVVLVHAGVCDNSMWDAVEPALTAAGHDVVRHELRGFGETPMPAGGRFSNAGDLEAALDEPAALVGASFGGQVCLELAARRPDLVERLVLLDAALPDHDFSAEVLEHSAEEERLFEAGDLDAVAELNASFWAPRAHDAVRAMQRRALELQFGSQAEAEEPESIDLSLVRAPALVAWGELDHEDFKQIGQRLGAELPDARTAAIAGAGHLPALERPEATSELLLEFLPVRP